MIFPVKIELCPLWFLPPHKQHTLVVTNSTLLSLPQVVRGEIVLQRGCELPNREFEMQCSSCTQHGREKRSRRSKQAAGIGKGTWEWQMSVYSRWGEERRNRRGGQWSAACRFRSRRGETKEKSVCLRRDRDGTNTQKQKSQSQTEKKQESAASESC